MRRKLARLFRSIAARLEGPTSVTVFVDQNALNQIIDNRVHAVQKLKAKASR